MALIWEKTFYGTYVDIEIERRKWAKDNPIIIVGQKTIRNVGVRKVHEQIIFYTHDNSITKWFGFRKELIHYNLSTWY